MQRTLLLLVCIALCVVQPVRTQEQYAKALSITIEDQYLVITIQNPTSTGRTFRQYRFTDNDGDRIMDEMSFQMCTNGRCDMKAFYFYGPAYLKEVREAKNLVADQSEVGREDVGVVQPQLDPRGSTRWQFRVYGANECEESLHRLSQFQCATHLKREMDRAVPFHLSDEMREELKRLF